MLCFGPGIPSTPSRISSSTFETCVHHFFGRKPVRFENFQQCKWKRCWRLDAAWHILSVLRRLRSCRGDRARFVWTRKRLELLSDHLWWYLLRLEDWGQKRLHVNNTAIQGERDRAVTLCYSFAVTKHWNTRTQNVNHLQTSRPLPPPVIMKYSLPVGKFTFWKQSNTAGR